MGGMYYGAISFNQDLSSWDVSRVRNMNCMFKDAKSFNHDLSSWNVENVSTMNHMFTGDARVRFYSKLKLIWPHLT